MKKIIITGSTGFIGRNLVPKLISQGYVVLEITRDIEKSNQLFGEETEKIQIDDLDFKEKIINFNPDIVVHLAAYLTASDEWSEIVKLIDSNIIFLSKVLNAIAETSLKLFINTGTFAEYYLGDGQYVPAYFYSATKTASRALLNYYSNAYDFKHVTVVPYTIYGSIDSQKKILDLMIDSLDSQTPLEMSPGDQLLDFIYIIDVVDFYSVLISSNESILNGTNYLLGTGKGLTLKDISKILESLTKKKCNIIWGAKPYRKSDVMHAVAQNTELINLGWSVKTSIEKGLKYLLKI